MNLLERTEQELTNSMAAEIKRAVAAEYALRVATINESYPAVKNAYDNYQSILMTKKEMIQAAWKQSMEDYELFYKHRSIKPQPTEEQLREDYPALKQAWDNYQTLLKIAIGDHEQ